MIEPPEGALVIQPERTLRGEDSDRAPICPICQERFVILATHPGRDAAGAPIRRQLWGCPRGHATAYRTDGSFGLLEVFEE
jgi:hypothetical protein